MNVRTPKTILFLEDERELLATVGTVLRDQGYRVEGMASAEDAFKFVDKTVPDLFLVDIKLPGIDGLLFFDEIRKRENLKSKPFVFLTAFNNIQAAIYAKERGAAEYITKPFDFEYLITRVKDLLESK